MNNTIDLICKYDKIFVDLFKVDMDDTIKDKLSYKNYPKWDSLMQMFIIQRIEQDFSIEISFDEFQYFDSYYKGLDYIKTKLE